MFLPDNYIEELQNRFYRKRFPLLSNQTRLWTICHEENQNPSYNIALSYHLIGPIDYNALKKSLDILFYKHHTIYSVFKQEDGVPYIEIIPRPVLIESVDFSNKSGETARDELLSFAGETLRKCFDIEHGPLYRIFLLKDQDSSHYFHMVIHHLIFDGWSRRIFVLELNKLYNSIIKNEAPQLVPLPLQSYDLAQDEINSRNLEMESGMMKFWREYLQDCPTEIKFPYDHSRKKNTSGLGSRLPFELPKECSLKLKQISSDNGSTLFNTLISTLAVLLQKYSGENDICIGIPVSNRRSNPSLNEPLGLFVNNIVIRLQIETESRFYDHLSYTKKLVRSAIANSQLPFEKIVEAVNPRRISGVNPLFQISFSWLNKLTIPIEGVALKGERISLQKGVSPFDITFYMWEDGDFIKGDIEYNVDILEHDSILRLHDNFLGLINKLIDNPGEQIKNISIISESEKELVYSFRGAKSEYPSDYSIVKRFVEQAGLYPTKPAVVFMHEVLSYHQLHLMSDDLARTLLQFQLGKNETVAVILDKSFKMIVGILGILKAGGAYVPIDPDYPLERINFLLNDSGCRIILTQKKYLGFSLQGRRIINLDSIDYNQNDAATVENVSNPMDLAYVMYTSGTTGNPKGCLITQKAVIRLVCNANYISLTPEDRILSTGASVFDAFTFEIWGALLNGGSLILVEKDTILDTQKLEAELIRNNATVLWLTSPLFTQIAEIGTGIFGQLKVLIVGGDLLSAFHINKVRKANPGLKVLNGYGPTENTTFSTTYLINKDFDSNIPIGKPVSNSSCYIFDENMNYQPIGLIGELYVGGDGLSAGYLNRDDLNIERFIEHPFNPGERLFRTGDFARWLNDGNIEFHGRKDNQLKLNGIRVELGEIESVLAKLDGVKGAIVKFEDVDSEHPGLVAFLHTDASFRMNRDEISNSLNRVLPKYMIPAFFEIRNEFPLSPTGKIDRLQLKFNRSNQIIEKNETTEILSSTEKELYTIWEKMLKLKHFSKYDSFFDIGGNSLMAIRIINKIQTSIGVALSFKELVLNPTIEQLADYIQKNLKKANEEVQLVHLTHLTNLPLSVNQKRLWLLNRLSPQDNKYITSSTYQFVGSVEVGIFIKSVQILFERHFILFSVIREVEMEPVCDIVPRNEILKLIDLTGLTQVEKESKINAYIDQESTNIFDLEKGPLYRLSLIKVNEQNWYFHSSIHHIIFDGWSLQVFNKDLEKIYNGLLGKQSIQLEKLEFQQYDYADWERHSFDSKKEEALIAYWKNNLDGIRNILNFPYDFPRLDEPSNIGRREAIILSSELSGKLREISRAEDTSLYVILLSAFAILLNKYTSANDICIGSPIASRPHSKLENIIGMFVNTLVLRLRLDRDLSFRQFIQSVKTVVLNAIENQDLPFEKIVNIVNPDRKLNINPIFQMCFAWHDNVNAPLNLDKLEAKRVRSDAISPLFDLTFNMWQDENIIEGEIVYDRGLFESETIARLKHNFIYLLNSMIVAPNSELSDFSPISPFELQILLDFNKTENIFQDSLIQDVFEKQAAQNPLKTAIFSGSESITYKELNYESNQLAWHLINSGVKPGDTLGICFLRSIEMIISVLAALKAGCCYLPLDNTFPLERLVYMLNDSGARLIITSSSLRSKLSSFSAAKLVIFEEFKILQKNYRVENPGLRFDSGSPAYIMYTSGSTGNPKGVRVHHQAVVNFIHSMSKKPGMNKNDKLLAVVTFSFDMSVFELLMPLSNGANIVIASNQEINDGQTLVELITKHDITFIQASPSFWNILLSFGWTGKSNLTAISGGEALSMNLVRQLLPKLKELWNCYGPTEATIYATSFNITDLSQPILIGKPLDNTKVYILNHEGSKVPIGVIGEIAIGGLGLAKGYYNKPELSSGYFVGYEDGKTIYKTGDLGRFRSDGNVELVGRIDNQIKMRGFRIEPGEIETVLNGLKGVTESVVKLHKFDEYDERLVAFLNVEDNFVLAKDNIIKKIGQQLPQYMIPSFFQKSVGFPRTPNGKIDRNALVFNLSESEFNEHKDLDILNPTERTIYEIWSEILKTKDISKTDNFFEIGGNSLIAIHVQSKIESVFKVRIGLRIFFDSPCIKDLAEAVDISLRKGDASKVDLGKTEQRIIKGEI